MTRGRRASPMVSHPVGDLVAARVREMRKVAGLSIEALAARCGSGFTRNTITNIEIGRKDSISVDELAVIADALGIRPWELWPDLKGPDPGWLIEVSEPEAAELAAWLQKRIRITKEEPPDA